MEDYVEQKIENPESFKWLKGAIEQVESLEDFIDILFEIDSIEFNGIDEDGKYSDNYRGEEFLETIALAGQKSTSREDLFSQQIKDLEEGLININSQEGSESLEINLKQKAIDLFTDLWNQGQVDQIKKIQSELNHRLHTPDYYEGMFLAGYLIDHKDFKYEIGELLGHADSCNKEYIYASDLSKDAQEYLQERIHFGNSFEPESLVILYKHGSKTEKRIWSMFPRDFQVRTDSLGDPTEWVQEVQPPTYGAIGNENKWSVLDDEGLHKRVQRDFYVSILFAALGHEKEEFFELLRYLVGKAEEEGRTKILFSELDDQAQEYLKNNSSFFEIKNGVVVLDVQSEYWKELHDANLSDDALEVFAEDDVVTSDEVVDIKPLEKKLDN